MIYYRHRQREDGGTPPILARDKGCHVHPVKREMGVERILQREEEMLQRLFDRLEKIPVSKYWELQKRPGHWSPLR